MSIQDIKRLYSYAPNFEINEPDHFVTRRKVVKDGRTVYIRSGLYTVWAVGSYRIATLVLYSVK